MAVDRDLPCSIVDVIELLGIPVIRNTGTQLYCRCPFCDDRSAHFNVKVADDVFRCHRCGRGGGVLHLYSFYHNVSLRTAGDELRSLFSSGARAERRLRASSPEVQIIASEEMQVASSAERDSTYTNLLSMLTLADTHREALRKRGLSDEEIDQLGYRTTPAVRTKRIVAELQERGCKLAGVPGFYCDRETGGWLFATPSSGIMCPDRNSKGEIEAIQVRLDNPQKGKFRNLTSSEKYYGTSAHCCPHFVGVDESLSSVYLTEGVMKSDVAFCLSKRLGMRIGFVGLTGVSNKSQLQRALQELREFRISRIVMAFDSDFKVKPNVAEARNYAINEVIAQGFEIVPLSWDQGVKGIDDLFLSFVLKKS